MPAELPELAALPAPQQRQAQKQQLKHQVHLLAQEGLSHAAIARRVGIHRVTVKSWLQQEPPPVEAEGPAIAEQDTKLPSPPAPWSSWDQVRQVREALQEHRFLLLRRPENLNSEDQAQVAVLLTSPIGAELQVLRSFLEDWYRLWKDKTGQRRDLEEARARYDAWRTDEAYRAVAQLRRVQQQMTDAKFDKLSQFLRHSAWEATNNGAERAGRAFRHRQAPHFNLRQVASIERCIVVSARLRKEMALRPPDEPFHTCQRGRKRRAPSSQLAVATAA
jgi:transposase